MDKITIKNTSITGKPLIATFLPEEGMNLMSYRLGDIEVIDQNTFPVHKERKEGIGALIGPHFYQQKNILTDDGKNLFSHMAKEKAKKRKEPFPHGIARYVPWKYIASETQIKGRLSGDDFYKGIPLKVFEGQNFVMNFEVRLLSNGLFIEYKIDSERPSLVGLHYYYALFGKGTVHGTVQPNYRDKEKWKPLPKEWNDGKKTHLHFSLPQEADYRFFPVKKTLTDHNYRIIFDTRGYSLHIDYNTFSDTEISYRLYHPKGGSFICIDLLSAQDPLKPKLTRNVLEAKIEILPFLRSFSGDLS